MSETTADQPSFGAGNVLNRSFSVLFRKFGPVFLATMVPQLFLAVLFSAFVGGEFVLVIDDALPDETYGENQYWAIWAVYLLLLLVTTSFSTALVVRIAYDEFASRPTSLPAALLGALSNLAPILVLSTFAFLLIMIGLIFLIIPGLYIYAVFCAAVPAIIVEQAGFRGLQRSAELTKDYRWPIAGTLFVAGILVQFSDNIFETLTSVVYREVGEIEAVVTQSIVEAPAYAFLSVVTALIYARLRELKEGVDAEDLAEVFA